MQTSSTPLVDRKGEHLGLADNSQMAGKRPNPHFDYEPLLGAHPDKGQVFQRPLSFLGKEIRAPLWVSSMTGGTVGAGEINRRLARVCAEFGLGMGLGSCRVLLGAKSPRDSVFSDFDLRPILGDELPLMGNVGIAQIEHLLLHKKTHQLDQLVERLRLDGLFVHINPLQEWFQPEGDLLNCPPLDTLQELLDYASFPVAIKEVGQGMGPESLREALKLPLAAIEFGAFGGTNFSALEMHRNPLQSLEPMAQVGHTAEEMVTYINTILSDLGRSNQCPEFIISGGVTSFLHGLGLIQSLNAKAVYGQAHALLARARRDYPALREYVREQLLGLELAHRYLVPKKRGGS